MSYDAILRITFWKSVNLVNKNEIDSFQIMVTRTFSKSTGKYWQEHKINVYTKHFLNDFSINKIVIKCLRKKIKKEK